MKGYDQQKIMLIKEEKTKNHVLYRNLSLYNISQILLQWKNFLKIIGFMERIFPKDLFWYWKGFYLPTLLYTQAFETVRGNIVWKPFKKSVGVMKLNVLVL